MFILDTDHLSLLERADSVEGSRLRARLANVPEYEVAATIVSFEEQMRGWLARLASAKTVAQQIHNYAQLKRQLGNYRTMLVLDFDDRAGIEFERLKSSRIRVGTMDMKIAAISLALGATLLTRNTRDFAKITGLKIADWIT